MPASSALLTDMQTVVSAGPSPASLALAIAPAGPIMDYQGNAKLVMLKLQEAKVLLSQVIIDTDPTTDAANLTLLQNIQTSLS